MASINCTNQEFDVIVWFCTDGPVGNGETSNVNAFTMPCDIFSNQDQIGSQSWDGISQVSWDVPEELVRENFLGQCAITKVEVHLFPLVGTKAFYEVHIYIDYCRKDQPAYHFCGQEQGEHVLVVSAEFDFNFESCDIFGEPPEQLD